MIGQDPCGYYVDIVMCIDKAESMSPFISNIKANTTSVYQKFIDCMEEMNSSVGQLRIKVIAFGDVKDSGPFCESNFFTLPDQNEEFKSFVDDIETTKGGDIPRNALEAIALALKSDWTTGGYKRRHLILMFSDAPALPLDARKDCENYPAGMPVDLVQLGAWWEGKDSTMGGTYQPRAGRLVAFVPNAEPWMELQAWSRYWPAFCKVGAGLSDVDFQSSIDLMVGSF